MIFGTKLDHTQILIQLDKDIECSLRLEGPNQLSVLGHFVDDVPSVNVTADPRPKALKRKLIETGASDIDSKRVPRIQVPRTQVPRIQVPRTQVPRIQVPRTQVPRIQVPRTQVPRIQVPRTQVPQIQVPQMQASQTTQVP
ncbi:hypothetical protein C8R41DRAFT_864857 [Lentinula lateritia]|uniref:Uncharacterized protein n=1 Tax=Lentinula lateritia TaxID=40482 RepID=A0ABQ8VPX0_9AGAR|nr:hypothetical protein C8R41DRAFT_864857 [Lentinula lateritia]